MNTPSLPLSFCRHEAEGDKPKKTREEWKKAKELDDAQKAGTVPAAVDEEGKDINPHIPQYIATAPYFGSCRPTLTHQRPQPKEESDFDRKRGRWNGFDPSDNTAVVEEHKKVEDYRRHIKAQKLKDEEMSDDEPEDEDKNVDSVDMPGTKVDSKQRITVRNLRIPEDTAKYLRNLDPDSAHYDAKSRSMRENPYNGRKKDEVDFAGENFARFSGDTVDQAKAQLSALDAYEKGVDVSLQAEPTKLELPEKQFVNKMEEFNKKAFDDFLEKYGGKEHLNAPFPNRKLLISQTENYVEYSRNGEIIQRAEKQTVRSKYEEDVYPGNHTSVWGSYWQDGIWGYNCCHSFVKKSYCTGEAGKQAKPKLLPSASTSSVNTRSHKTSSTEEELNTKTLLEIHREKKKMRKKQKKEKKRIQKQEKKRMQKQEKKEKRLQKKEKRMQKKQEEKMQKQVKKEKRLQKKQEERIQRETEKQKRKESSSRESSSEDIEQYGPKRRRFSF
ncbi:pre-mRNA-splicing factor Slu7-like [Procambarus clarkii]|uniref:pre-mRNA-splicing factor Slu7-like n=1 Tax=Procambarus clarkii TaxID=6728 RepID=UPI003742FC59